MIFTIMDILASVMTGKISTVDGCVRRDQIFRRHRDWTDPVLIASIPIGNCLWSSNV